MLDIKCIGCNKKPEELFSEEMLEEQDYQSATAYAKDDGTYNRENGHFVCDSCYIEMGMPSSAEGWVAP